MVTSFGSWTYISHTVLYQWCLMLHWLGWAIHDTATLQHGSVLEGSFHVQGSQILPSTVKEPEQDIQQSMHFLFSSQAFNIPADQNFRTSAGPVQINPRENTQSIFFDITPSSAAHVPEVEKETIHSDISPSMFFSVWEASTQPVQNDDVVTMVTESINHGSGHFENHTLDFINSTEVSKVQQVEVSDYTTAEIFGISCGIALLIFAVAAVSFWLYRRQQNPSSSRTNLAKYIQNNITISYINGHIELPDDNMSDEIISLDNDSFLNSLDSSSFTNMWASRNKHHTHF